ncbi:MAG: helix-turn-helix transcriptional regulator [Acutalibacteraceae bacterium]|nr:helix-turn-helix transcriptional regulator [Acutalibacteraceae bacterium]
MDICISDNLKMLRQRYSYTLEAVAEIIGVSRQAVAKWEAGESIPDLINSAKLSVLFKVTLDELVFKPMTEAVSNACNLHANDHVMGMLTISEDGQIRLPETVMKLFDLQIGENVLLLADKKQGIAIVKCSQLDKENS